MSVLERVEAVTVSGSTLITVPDPTLPLCRFIVAFRRGGFQDPVGCAGLHRLTTELMLRGTLGLERSRFHERLEHMGSSLYAFASGDVCGFRGSTLRRHLPATLGLLTEAILEPRLDEGELDALRDEVREGLANELDDEEAVASIWFRRALLSGSPSVRRSSGEVGELDAITPSRIREGYEALRGAECILVATGDFDTTDLKRFLGGVYPEARRARAVEPLPDLPRLAKPRILLVEQPEHEQVQLRLGRLALSGQDPGRLAFWLGATAFAGTFTSPFTQEIRERRGWSYTAHGEWSRFGRVPGAWILVSAPALNDVLACLELELSLYGGVSAGELDDDVIDFAREYLQNRFPRSLASASDVLFPLFRGAILGHSPKELAQTPQALAEVDNAKVRETLRSALGGSEVAAVLVGSIGELGRRLENCYPEAEIVTVDYRDEHLSPFATLR